jgi:hypothetical protein
MSDFIPSNYSYAFSLYGMPCVSMLSMPCVSMVYRVWASVANKRKAPLNLIFPVLSVCREWCLAGIHSSAMVLSRGIPN